jgi:hypothetical protein
MNGLPGAGPQDVFFSADGVPCTFPLPWHRSHSPEPLQAGQLTARRTRSIPLRATRVP